VQLAQAAEELIRARQQLQAADPNSRAIQETRQARLELQQARDTLERLSRTSSLDARAEVLLERIQAAIPAADYLRELVDKLDAAELIAWRR
jgi:hypothetical protein